MNFRHKRIGSAKAIILKRLTRFFIFYLLVFVFPGCVYYNTFYNARNYYKQGLKLLKNNPNAAKTNFEKSIEKSAIVVKKHFRSKWADDALFLVAMSYYHMGEYVKAIKNFDDLLVVFPNSNYQDQAKYYRALAYLKDNDYGAALVILYDLKENSPKFASAAAFQIARSFYLKEEYAQAIDSISSFIKNYPRAKERNGAGLILAESHFKLKDWAPAAYWFKDYLGQGRIEQKERLEKTLKLAECLLNQGKYDSTRIRLTQDFSRYPDLANQANLLIGKSLLAENNIEVACQSLIRIRTGDCAAEAYFLMGKLYEEDKEFEPASAYYDTASQFSPNSEFGILAKKRLSLLGRIQTKSSESKDRAEAQFLLAEVYSMVLNEDEAAINEYQKVYDSFPDSYYAPKALYAQAWIMENRLSQENYKTILETIISKYPRTTYANSARRSLGLPEIQLTPKDTATPKPPKESLPGFLPPKSESLPPPKPESLMFQQESLPEIRFKPSQPNETIVKPPIPEKREAIKRELEIPPIDSNLVTPKTEEMASQPAESIIQKEVKITPTKPETLIINIAPIHFDFDRSDIKTGDAEILQAAARQLKKDSIPKVLIEGYTDPIGTESYNYSLGLRRANSARAYLIKLGINKERISTISFGENKLLTTDSLEYWKNRRCEFVIQNED